LLVWLLIGAFVLAMVIVFNLLRLLVWVITEIYNFGRRQYYQYKIRTLENANPIKESEVFSATSSDKTTSL
jgi:hypothetical protein